MANVVKDARAKKPTEVSGHAVERYMERYELVHDDSARRTLVKGLRDATFIEYLPDEDQSIWRLLIGPEMVSVPVVVNADGIVSTVLPLTAVKPMRRPKKRAPR